MQLDRLGAVLRPRNAWEAIDLGMQMARKHFLCLWVLWWLSALPVTVLAVIVLYAYPGYIATAVWWFKPLFEPLLVFWLSRALFGDRLPLHTAARHWWGVSRGRLAANLLWRRLSPNRSLYMPVTVLERPGPATWSRRAGLFSRNYSGGFWLTIAGAHFETVLMIGLLAGIYMLVPSELLPDWELADWFEGNNTLFDWATAAVSLVVMSVIAPFYVAGGFALYLSRRTDLEAWDIELNFRRFAQALRGVAPAIFLALGVTIGSVPDAGADDLRQRSATVIGEVLAAPVFGEQVERTTWELEFDRDGSRRRTDSAFDIAPLADFLRVLLWLAVFGFVIWLVVRVTRYLDGLKAPPTPTKDTVPDAGMRILGIDDAEPLPDDVPMAVRDLLQQQHLRAAVALLYRASLDALIRRHGLVLSESATERECLTRVRATRPNVESADFAELTGVWIGVAYANMPPVELQVLDLLDAWVRHYAQHGTAP